MQPAGRRPGQRRHRRGRRADGETGVLVTPRRRRRSWPAQLDEAAADPSRRAAHGRRRAPSRSRSTSRAAHGATGRQRLHAGTIVARPCGRETEGVDRAGSASHPSGRRAHARGAGAATASSSSATSSARTACSELADEICRRVRPGNGRRRAVRGRRLRSAATSTASRDEQLAVRLRRPRRRTGSSTSSGTSARTSSTTCGRRSTSTCQAASPQHYHSDGLYMEEFLICNVAVVDTDLENGAIDVLPGTNREFYKFWRYAVRAQVPADHTGAAPAGRRHRAQVDAVAPRHAEQDADAAPDDGDHVRRDRATSTTIRSGSTTGRSSSSRTGTSTSRLGQLRERTLRRCPAHLLGVPLRPVSVRQQGLRPLVSWLADSSAASANVRPLGMLEGGAPRSALTGRIRLAGPTSSFFVRPQAACFNTRPSGATSEAERANSRRQLTTSPPSSTATARQPADLRPPALDHALGGTAKWRAACGTRRSRNAWPA